MTAPLKTWLEAALGFLYPPVCQLCRTEAATPSDGFVGAGCRQRVRRIRPPFCERCGLPYEGDISASFECANCREMQLAFRRARAAASAQGVVLDAIHRFKYRRELWLEPFLAGLLVEAAAQDLATGDWNLIVPVPLHPVKQREREFNQAERLSRRLGQCSGLPVDVSLLRRLRPTGTQTQLTRPERVANMRQAFGIAPGRDAAGLRVVLVDDVLTTGSTTSACAAALRAGGAADVCVWTVARGI